MQDLSLLKSDHYKRVEKFMQLAKQDIPGGPIVPSEDVRKLRARLIFEEAMETIKNGLGVVISIPVGGGESVVIEDELMFDVARPFDRVETIDGCCDLKVVTTGTLIACGVPDEPFQKLVDENNLEKFGPGHSWREDGKLIKPPGHKPPDIAGKLAELLKK